MWLVSLTLLPTRASGADSDVLAAAPDATRSASGQQNIDAGNQLSSADKYGRMGNDILTIPLTGGRTYCISFRHLGRRMYLKRTTVYLARMTANSMGGTSTGKSCFAFFVRFLVVPLLTALPL